MGQRTSSPRLIAHRLACRLAHLLARGLSHWHPLVRLALAHLVQCLVVAVGHLSKSSGARV